MRGFIRCEEINQAQWVNGGRYANGNMVLQIPCKTTQGGLLSHSNALYDKQSDPHQNHPINDENLENRMAEKMRKAMQRAGAPDWQFERMGLEE